MAGTAGAVEQLGATARRGDLDDTQAMQAGMAGCDVVVHAAGYTRHVSREQGLAELRKAQTEPVDM